MNVRKKLIEVALPLDAINKASAREKAIRHGHPSTLHLWWARRPLAAARAVIFAQMVDDPSTYVDVLRSDPRLRRKAERVLKSRRTIWDEAFTLARKAEGTGLSVPHPGPEPTLDEILAEHERERLFRLVEALVVGRTAQTQPSCEQRGMRSGRAGVGRAPTTLTTRRRKSSSTASACRLFTTHSRGGERCRLRRNGSVSRATRAISTL